GGGLSEPACRAPGRSATRTKRCGLRYCAAAGGAVFCGGVLTMGSSVAQLEPPQRSAIAAPVPCPAPEQKPGQGVLRFGEGYPTLTHEGFPGLPWGLVGKRPRAGKTFGKEAKP